jgi:hypothetical protein
MLLVAVFFLLMLVSGAILFDLNPILGCVFIIFVVALVFTSFSVEQNIKKTPEYRVILERLNPCLSDSDQVKCMDDEIGLIKTEPEAMTLVMLFHKMSLHLTSQQLQAIRSQIIANRPQASAGHLTGADISTGPPQTSALEAKKQ